ncbi:MAG: tyrosine-protein phosphatase [Coxiellaceae bacterium]|nr:tyrosine-protein phosphatase [Coxiellaceae bacterium]
MAAESKTVWKRVVLIALSMLMVLFLAYMFLRNNIHTVTPGALYRSAQLSPERLKRLIRMDHIRTIINLRGRNENMAWYRDELAVSRAMGVQHYDIRLSSTHLPKTQQLHRLIDLFETAPRPILLHCQGGADRTGFASAMWMLMHGESLLEARQAYSILYFVHRPDSIGKQVIPLYAHWLKHQHYQKSTTSHFMQWVSVAQLGKQNK